MTDPGFETVPDGGPRTVSEIRQQLTELAAVKDAAAACGRDDFATGVVLSSLREHELDLLEELRDGAVVLLEKPVKVTFNEEEPSPPVLLQYGKYARGRLSTEEDFQIAEWRGESLDDGA